MEVSDQIHAPTALSPGERAPDTHCIGGWVGSITGLNAVDKRVNLALPGSVARRYID
jgi:hypothetical protein